ncbi:MAG TPA: sulfotransferase [bacterium]|nr:sulfotransferase [bacterium]HPS30652.1 sulfotransferase [bacterium]
MIKNLKILKILYKAFGFRFKYIGILIFRAFISGVMLFSLFLDRIFFPKSAKQSLKNPIFLIGHLRSGTTFVHRFITKNCDDIQGFYLWQMVFPALTMRKIIRPLLPVIKNISFDAVYDPKIHKTSLTRMEADDIALSFRFFDGLLSWIYFYSWNIFKNEESFRNELLKVSRQQRFICYLKDVYRKNIYKSEKRMFSKSFSLLFSVDSIENEFENPKILLILRNPAEAVPSMMSLEKKVQESLNNFSRQPDNLQKRYFQNLYRTSLFYYETFHEVAKKKKDSENFMLVTHRQIMTGFDETFEKIISFYGLEKSEKLKKALAEQSSMQKEFKTEHIYSLDQFGITKEQIEKDFAFIYENYDV